jgi:spore maturation protein CgeB
MLLEEDNASIGHFLEPMKHYVPFTDTRDAAEKIRFYRSNPVERKAIADKAYRLVHTRFSNNAFWSRCIRLLYG